ncbi:MAG: methyltransferase domain-containing protein [Bacteroidetes bacterium]|nr:methyltransferase domain-containing protein [Bacteroidota bacterium]
MALKLINFIKWLLFKQPTLARLTLNGAFRKVLHKIRPGKILEIGAGEYNSNIHYITGNNHYFSLDLFCSVKPTVVGDACVMPFRDNSIDSIIMLEVIEHVLTPSLVIKECRRVLKNNGIMIGSTRFICSQHEAPNDYYRFADDSIAMFLGDFSECKIDKLGNRLHVLIDIITENFFFLRVFNRVLQYIPLKSSTCYSGLLFFAKK